ncbi:transcription antitermination protein [Halobacteriales archaeon Cl-PHB]
MSDDPVESVRSAADTELQRLGSEKALIAATDATLDTEAILGALADDLATATATLEEWATAVEDPDVTDALTAAASRFDAATADVAADLAREPSTDATLGDHLASADGDVERAGAGLLGLPLVLDRTLLQVVSYFVNEADTTRADLARDLRDDCDDVLDLGRDVLTDSADRQAAEAAAVAVVEAAYEDYAATLEGMGLDPKPIC